MLYIANFTANRVEVMSLTDYTIQTSINVAAQPSSLALSPDGRWLLVAHYGNFATGSPGNGLTLIDLANSNAKQTFTLGNPTLGVAFGLDNRALVVTTTEFILFDPQSGSTDTLATVAAVAAKAIPQPSATFPGNIVSASMAVSSDGLVIYGFGGEILEWRYEVVTHSISSTAYTASPPLGPRTVSVNWDGSLATIGWSLQDARFATVAQFSSVAGLYSVGSTLFDAGRNVIYAQIPPAGTPATGNTTPPILQIVDADNLTLRERSSCLRTWRARACCRATATRCTRFPTVACWSCRSAA